MTVINETDISVEELRSLALSEPYLDDDGLSEDRLGKVTASSVKWVVIRNSYGKPYATYYAYLKQLAIERVIAKRVRFSSKYTNHGKENEAPALVLYEERTGSDVRQGYFVEHPDLAAGATPDAFVDEDGLAQIKAPNTSTMIDYIISAIPEDDEAHELLDMLGLKGYEWKEYYDQMQWEMYAADKQWNDFVVYDPDWPEDGEIWVKRIERNDTYINETMIPRVKEFLDKVTKLENYLRKTLIGVEV